MEATGNVKVLEKALIVLDTIREAGRPIGVNEIAKICSVNLTTAFRFLKTMKKAGWVYQDKDDKYIVGRKISFVTEKSNFYLALKEVAYYTMSQLSDTELQAMNLVVRDNERCFILQQSRTEKIVDYVPPCGTYLPIYASACGKVLMSELPPLILGKILSRIKLKKLTRNTVASKSELLAALDAIRKKGYSVDRYESQEGGFCIAVPVRSHNGEIYAALSFSGFIGDMTDDKIDYFFNILKNASIEITDNLFGRDNVLPLFDDFESIDSADEKNFDTLGEL